MADSACYGVVLEQDAGLTVTDWCPREAQAMPKANHLITEPRGLTVAEFRSRLSFDLVATTPPPRTPCNRVFFDGEG